VLEIWYNSNGSSQTNEAFHIPNYLDTPLRLFFRAQPLQDQYNGDIELEDKSQIVWLGSLQHLLPEIPARGKCTVEIPLMVLNAGQWKILYNAESVGGEAVFWNSEPIFLKSQ
jgi:hypothetical protein